MLLLMSGKFQTDWKMAKTWQINDKTHRMELVEDDDAAPVVSVQRGKFTPGSATFAAAWVDAVVVVQSITPTEAHRVMVRGAAADGQTYEFQAVRNYCRVGETYDIGGIRAVDQPDDAIRLIPSRIQLLAETDDNNN
jgi:hypothetical protein